MNNVQDMRGKPFTNIEIKFIKDNYSQMNTAEMASHLRRDISSIYSKAYSLGLNKSPEYLNSENSGRLIKGEKRGQNTRFSKGHTPWNKGKKMTEDQYKKAAPTMFKKGHKAHNARYDGYISVRKSKGVLYAWVKMAEGKFKLLHRVIWEKYNGKIPENHNVIFKDGNQANLDINNLHLVSNAELMKANSIQRYPEDLKKLILANAKLKREINKIISNE